MPFELTPEQKKNVAQQILLWKRLIPHFTPPASNFLRWTFGFQDHVVREAFSRAHGFVQAKKKVTGFLPSDDEIARYATGTMSKLRFSQDEGINFVQSIIEQDSTAEEPAKP
jgi:hypothetical protein